MGIQMAVDFLDEKLESSKPFEDLLPFFHSCDAFFFRNIILDRKIVTTKCNVFEDENLLYLFYGRPAYKNSDQTSSKLNSLMPISFILKSAFISDIKRIIPFDTGAFKRGLYKRNLHPNMEMRNFFLTPDKKSIPKFISYFFKTNHFYFSGTPKGEILFDPLDFEIEAYYRMIEDVSKNDVDDRKATIEIQLEHDIDLSADSIEAVIIPENFASSEIVKNIIINELKAELLTYECFGIPSNHYYSQVLQLTKQYFIKKNYLNGT